MILNGNAQTLNIGNVFNSDITSKTNFGINAPYLFNHLLDDNYEPVPNVREELYETNFDLIRFPGGTIGNYYRSSLQGYGLLSEEVGSIINNFNCAGGVWCLANDEFATRNYIYDLLDFAEHRFETTGRKTDLLQVLSVLYHFYYNIDEINNLENIQNLEELDQAVNDGLISEDFKLRIMENYDAFKLLVEDENINVVGVEFGNELYFYREVTTFTKALNVNNPFDPFDLEESLEDIRPNMEKMVILIDFYRRILETIDSNVKIGFPAGGISHTGSSTNINLTYNTAVKELLLDHIDALIHHTYVSINGNYNGNPNNIANDDDHANMIKIKEEIEKYVDLKYDGSVEEFDLFFDLPNRDLEVWFTEWNGNIRTENNTIWDEWGNSVLHGIFLNLVMERIATSHFSSEYITQSILHTWTTNNNGFIHNMLSIEGEAVIKRIGYWANVIADFLKSDEVIKLSGSIQSSQQSYDFYSNAFYTSQEVEGQDCSTEKLILSFSNLRADEISTTFSFNDNKVTIDGDEYELQSGKMIAYKAENNLFSACGQTDFDETEENYDVIFIDSTISTGNNHIIDGYSSGIFEFIIKPVNQNCIPLSSSDVQSKFLVSISPNPVNDKLNVSLKPINNNYIGETLQIVNSLGQVVMQTKIVQKDITIDVKRLEKGIYFLSLSANFVEQPLMGSFVKK